MRWKQLAIALGSFAALPFASSSVDAATVWRENVHSNACVVENSAKPAGTWFSATPTDANYGRYLPTPSAGYSPTYANLMCPAPTRTMEPGAGSPVVAWNMDPVNATKVDVDLFVPSGIGTKPQAMTCGRSWNLTFFGCGTFKSATGSGNTNIPLTTAAELLGMISVGVAGSPHFTSHYTYVRLTGQSGVGGSGLGAVEYIGSF